MKNNVNKSKQKDPLISVIVPVYNVEHYLKECLYSIASQSYCNYEAILVDDGSIDRSGSICDQFSEKIPQFRVYHQKNSGLSAARNIALDNARGELITMVDSDDLFLSEDYLRILYDALRSYNADIALSGHVSFMVGEQVPQAINRPEDMLLLDGIEYGFWNNIPKNYLPNCATGKLYRRELFDNVRFPVGRLFEDIAVQHRLTFPCERIVFSGNHMYGYRMRPDGIERGSSTDSLTRDYILAFQGRIDYYLEQGHECLAYRAEQIMLRWLNKNKAKNQPPYV